MTYLLAAGHSELDRLRLQAVVWEEVGRRLLAQIPAPHSARALDVGCGALGWLRVLSEWVGPDGRVVGTDVDPTMLAEARDTLAASRVANAELVEDDLFASRLASRAFDLVHARFQLAPLGREEEQVRVYRGLLRPGGVLVLEEPDAASWRFNSEATAAHSLIGLIQKAFAAVGGDFNVGRRLPELLGGNVEIRAGVLALPPGHPYLRLPLQFATSLEPTLLTLVGREELDRLRDAVASELEQPNLWGTTFTLIQAWREIP